MLEKCIRVQYSAAALHLDPTGPISSSSYVTFERRRRASDIDPPIDFGALALEWAGQLQHDGGAIGLDAG